MRVKIQKDVMKYKEKLILGLTARQLITLGVSAAVGLLTYLGAKKQIGTTCAGMITFILLIFIMLVGCVSFQNMPLEKFLSVMFQNITRKSVRYYKNDKEEGLNSHAVSKRKAK
jgi:hypothetical protein